MPGVEDFGAVEGVSITVLIDNRAELMVKSTDTVKRFTDKPLLAEHGFAALIDLDTGARILWDAGMTELALPENARRRGIGLATIDLIALSHGHDDHFTAMTHVLHACGRSHGPRTWGKEATMDEIRQWVQGAAVPLVVHPAAFRERWGIGKDGKKHGPLVVPRAEWEAAGAGIVLSEGPYSLAPGCWVTGEVPRQSFERSGVPDALHYRKGDRFVRDHLEDDQSIVLNVRRKGLVVLTGCAHSGIVNTVRYAQEISGVERVWAVMGGFHLARASRANVQQTINAIKALAPALVVPTHCTGFEASRAFAAQMPEQFVLGTVGTTYLF
jgi:7,8-dihydropterin-6-yl-methyl-4-(beta-D-ribofuranosyl)aminobenzene 5'-phosphate synthase